LLLALLALVTPHASATAAAQETERQRAQELWEQAVAAKGGRERLHAVTDILETYSDKTYVELDVFPDKRWYWSDDRPTPLGVSAEMINLGRDLSYDVHEWDSGPPVNRGKHNASEWPIVEMQLYYLLETRWVKPEPVKLYSGTIRHKSVDVIQTTVNGYVRVDFHLDRKSHLPLEVAFPSDDSVGIRYGRGTYYATFSDYEDVNGIQMPRKVGHLDKPKISDSVRVNVEYDPDIFERPPTIEAGPDAWKEK
jgi:hypothetical protein